MSKKRIITILALLVVVGLGVYAVSNLGGNEGSYVATSTPSLSKKRTSEPVRRVIGASVDGREIEAFTYPPADAYRENSQHIVFVGGIHGGYEWNTVLLSYELMDFLENTPSSIPDRLAVSVIPVLNPDGLSAIIDSTGRFSPEAAPPTEETTVGRFNANEVDLNRNFDCNWQPESMWRGATVNAGSDAFSEPEAAAMRDYVARVEPDAVVFFHSAANGVYGSSCNDGILPETALIMTAYADASGYPAVESFDHYEITGDAEGWLAKIGIPSVSVELTSHEALEWEKNRAGIVALFNYFKTQQAN